MARQPLKPKPVPAIVPIALKLKALGYDPIPLYSGKGKPPKGWPTNPNTPEDINGWNGRTVALRMRGHADLFAIDMDIQHDGVLRAIIARYQERWPDFMARCVVRHSGAVKVMLIGRLSTARRYMHSGRYGVTEEHKGGNRVELFTANDARYIAVWGMHSTGRDYGFDGPEIVEVEYRALPEFLEDDLNELLTIANEEMEAAGLALSEKPGEDKGDVIYDLTPDMVAELEDGRTMTLKELEHEATGQFVYIHGRLFDPGSGTDNRIKCKTLRSCGLTMWDWGDGCVEHRWKHLGPQPEVLTPLLKGLVGDAATQPQATMFRSGLGAQAKAAAQAASEVAPAYPDDGAPFNVRLLWLLRAYGYCALNDSVIALFEAGMDCEIRPAAFERRFAAWYREEVTRNTVKRIPATHDWGLEEQRRHVDGARMHPGQAFPLYREGGKLWKNVYQRPRHEGTGDLEPFMRFFERFIPDRREREWLLDWMAHKQRRPDIPGSAIILVADNDEEEDERTGRFGTGRGSMFKILHRLYGPEYARGQSFSILDGSSSQSAYNSWIHGNVLVTVDETKTSATAHRRGEKKSVYEVLKDVVDPAPKGMTFNVKYGRAFWAYSYCSFWLATNHSDALSIPKNDRRFSILQNGAVLTPEQGRELAEWMDVPGNIAELSRFLERRDLTGFNMFQHLETTAKQTMIELGRSSVEEVLLEMIDDDSHGLVFTRQQLEHTVEDIMNPWERVKGGNERRRGGTQWRGEFAGAWNAYCVGLKTETGSPWRVRVGNRQVNLYCFRKRRIAAGKLNEARRRHEASKWGGMGTLKDHLIALNTQQSTHGESEENQ